MEYMTMTHVERETLWAQLEAMPGFLAESLGALSSLEAATPGPAETFSPVEHCWHLADLEREGFGVRIRRLLSEADPWLPDFDGARLAQERAYRQRSLAEAIEAFAQARSANLALLRSLRAAQWSRSGIQEGVGQIALCDIPGMMAQHDSAHRAEIAEWADHARPA